MSDESGREMENCSSGEEWWTDVAPVRDDGGSGEGKRTRVSASNDGCLSVKNLGIGLGFIVFFWGGGLTGFIVFNSEFFFLRF